MQFANCVLTFVMPVPKNAVNIVPTIAEFVQRFATIAPRNAQAWRQHKLCHFSLVGNVYPVTFAPHIAK
jgi:hypothetical protein